MFILLIDAFILKEPVVLALFLEQDENLGENLNAAVALALKTIPRY